MILHRCSHQGTIPFPQPIAVDFDALPPIIAIHGPNGAGKTTLLDALIAGFYLTMPFRPGPLHQVFKTRGFIDITWSPAPGAQRYRSRVNVDPVAGRTEASLFRAEGGPAIAGPLQKGYLDKIRELVGPLDVFLCTAYTVQPSYTTGKNAFSFLLAERSERRAIMAELLGLKAYGMHEAGARDRIRGLDTKLTGLRAVVKQFEGQVEKKATLEVNLVAVQGRLATARAELEEAQLAHADVQKRLQVARERLTAIDPYRQQKDTLTAEIGALERRWEAARRTRTETEAQVEKAAAVQWAPGKKEALLQERAALEPLKAQATQIEKELTALEDQLQEAIEAEQRDRGILAQEDAILAAAAATEELDEKLAEIGREIDAAMTADSETVTAYRDWLRDRNDLQHRTTIRDQIQEAIGIMDEVPCKGQEAFAGCKFLVNAATAQTRLPAAIEAVERLTEIVGPARSEPALTAPAMKVQRDALHQTRTELVPLLALRPDLQRAQDRAVTVSDRINRIGIERDDKRTLRAELRDKLGELAGIEVGLVTVEPSVKLALTLEAVRAVAAETVKQIEQLAEDLVAKRARFEECVGRLAGIEEIQRTAEQSEREVLQAAARVRSAQTVVTGVEREAASSETLLMAVVEIEKRLARARVELEPVAVDLEDWTLLAKAFGPAGIPALLVDRALPEIGALATDLLRECLGESLFTITLTTQKTSADEKKLLETLDVIIRRGSDALGAELLSGGEGVLISEALSLAITLFNASRAGGKRPYTLFRDEVGANLDETRSPAYTRLLARAAKLGGFHQVLFVSHNRAALDLADARLGIRDGAVVLS